MQPAGSCFSRRGQQDRGASGKIQVLSVVLVMMLSCLNAVVFTDVSFTDVS